jgi:LPS export ABC transporter protein LptC
MNNLISILLKYFSAAALIMGCCFVIYGCENDEEVIKRWTENRNTEERGTNIESYLSQEGSVKAKLTSPLMVRVIDTAPYVEFPKTLHVDFYNDSLTIETRLDSKYGKYFEKSDKVYLRDSVVVISVKGDTLKAPELWWDQNSKLFYTDSVAEYHSIDKRITGGKGLVATQDMSEVTFRYPTGPVKVPKNMQ